MKKTLAVIIAVMMMLSAVSVLSINAAEQGTESSGANISFDTIDALYVHGVLNSADNEAWQAWQSEHDEDFNEVNSDVKYFFLPTSADNSKADVYNGYSSTVTLNGVTIGSGETRTVSYDVETSYPVNIDGKTYTLKFMKSNAEAGIYINNSDADGNGTDLMSYLNVDKSRSATATGAIVEPDGSVDNTEIKKIKGRGNTTWGKAKKPYNITYNKSVSIAGMSKSKKYSILANYQDDTLSRNRFLYDLSDAVGMPYASDSRYVDFYVNGFYWGSYQMAEKVEVGDSYLVNDIDDTAYLNENGTINEDFPFVCEVDASAVEGEDYFVEASGNNKITIKAPELSEGDVGYEEVKAYVKTKFNEFYNAARSTTADLSQYADVESVTKLYLINEVSKNWDSGVSSMFFTYKQDENGNYKFYGSPVWDYDNSLGNAYGIESELENIGVDDYMEYSGWWCKYKGRNVRRNSSTNIMNNLSRNSAVLEAAPQIWFEDFVPALKDFFENNGSGRMMSSEQYYSYIKESAEMNYQSGWLLETSSWICDHTRLDTAMYDESTHSCVPTGNKTYAYSFDGAYDYCIDWFSSRCAWLSAEMYPDYTPSVKPELGDVNMDGKINILDATEIQKYKAGLAELKDVQLEVADVNGDSKVDILDATEIQKFKAGLINQFVRVID